MNARTALSPEQEARQRLLAVHHRATLRALAIFCVLVALALCVRLQGVS